MDRVAVKGGGGPDWMEAGFGSLWVRRDNGVVVRLAPDGDIEATVDAAIFHPPVCQGLGVSDTGVWACATSGTLIHIDPRTNRIAATVKVDKVNEQGRLVAYNGSIWLLTGDGDQLVGLDESTRRLSPPIALGAACTDTADQVLGAMLWIACPADDAVLRVDLQTGEVTGRVDGLPYASSVAADESVWVCTEDGLAKVDPASLSVDAVQPATGRFACSLRFSDGTLWVRTPSSFLTGIDTSSGEVATIITSPGLESGGDVIEFADALWVSAYDRGLVFKLNPNQP